MAQKLRDEEAALFELKVQDAEHVIVVNALNKIDAANDLLRDAIVMLQDVMAKRYN